MAEPFPPEFWDSLRRVKAAPKTYSHDVYWFPSSDVYDFREYERDSVLHWAGGGVPQQERVSELADDIRMRGQQEAALLRWNPDKLATSVGDIHLAEGNHRVAAIRNHLDMPYTLSALDRGARRPNVHSEAPDGVKRVVVWSGKPGPGGYYPMHPDPNQFSDFRGKTILPNGLPGSPDDRAMVKALGNSNVASRILKSMVRAGKVFGPAAGAIGLVAGLNDPAEALGATVDRVEGNKWASKQVTPKMKRDEREYYDAKRAKQRASNPLTALLDARDKAKRLQKKGAAR